MFYVLSLGLNSKKEVAEAMVANPGRCRDVRVKFGVDVGLNAGGEDKVDRGTCSGVVVQVQMAATRIEKGGRILLPLPLARAVPNFRIMYTGM